MDSQAVIDFVRDCYRTTEFVPLHAPSFEGNERAYVLETLDSTFVSSVGAFVDRFEESVARHTGSAHAVATVNGTAALHAALHVAGVTYGDLVITQPLTFVATCNALLQLGAAPVFVDIERASLGLDPDAVEAWLVDNAVRDGVDGAGCRHRETGRPIRAVVPMHTYGHPVRLTELMAVCERWGLCLVEDAAESLGSLYRGQHTGTLGRFGALSFNGNKILTTGGGGMVLCREEADGRRLKHVTTTAKVAHAYEFVHDEPGFNYRMPNLNAALGCAQMETLTARLSAKRQLAGRYRELFADSAYEFVVEPDYARSNYWLNAVLCADRAQRDELLETTNANDVMTRPAWALMHRLPMFGTALRGDLSVAEDLADRLVNLPSSPPSEESPA